MKSRYLSAAALVAAFAVAAIAPAGAAAHVRRVPVARALTIHAQPNPIVTGDPVVIFGRLFGRNHADRLLVLYFHGAGSPIGFMPVQTTRTDSTGAYEFSRADGFVDTNRSWYVASAGAVSRVVNERVASLVTITATGPGGVAEPSGSVLQTGRGYSYTFSGTVDPAGQTVALLQRQSASAGADHWTTIGSGPVNAAGTYSIAHTFVVPSSSGGDANVRVFIRRDVRNIGSASESLSYEIEQTQNPKLTITPTSYSIPEGSGDTIRSGAGGAYTFPVSPVNNTYYQVRSGAISSVVGSSGASGVSGSSGASGASGPADIYSAVAFVGVRDVLTVTTTPTTINQGQTVTFSGAVTPNETGHSIYLERENAAGTAWYVLAAGKVGPNSTYSLGWAFYEIGTQQVRVAITGGPLNEGAVTAPIAVTVDAIPAAALVPASG